MRAGSAVKRLLFLVLLGFASCAAAAGDRLWALSSDPRPDRSAGRKGPDGNSIFIDAPEGLILVDTGRHPEHSAALLAYARERGRPIAAIFNTHWHLDHSTGNTEIRAAFPTRRSTRATPSRAR